MTNFSNMANKPETPKVGVGVVLRNDDGDILLGLRKGAHGAGEWSLPGGHMALGEDFIATCKREVKEETGITIATIRKLGFTNDVFETKGLHYVTLFFEAYWDRKQPKVMEPEFCEEWRWFMTNALPDNVFPPLKRFLDDGGLE